MAPLAGTSGIELGLVASKGNVGVDTTHECSILSDEHDALAYLQRAAYNTGLT